MIKTAVIGLGKMGLSHAAILGGNKNVNLIAICDTSNIVLSAFKKYNPSRCHNIHCHKNYSNTIVEYDACLNCIGGDLFVNMN